MHAFWYGGKKALSYVRRDVYIVPFFFTFLFTLGSLRDLCYAMQFLNDTNVNIKVNLLV